MVAEFPQLGEVRDQRSGLRTAMLHLEDSAAAPVADRGDAWRAELDLGLAEVRSAWARHVAVTEAPDGLFEQIRTDAPQLSPRIQQLHREHEDLQVALTLITDDEPADADGARELVIDLVAKLVRHRQHGADVIYEAYSVDVGGDG
jgi:hypothetical protein